MTQEERQKEKELLLNVLKDGLPYGLQLQITDVDGFTFNGELRVLSKNWCRLNIADPVKRAKVKNQTIPLNYIYIKPYLRPMTSMTEEEVKELVKVYLSKYNSSYKYHNPISIDSIYIHDRYSWSAWIHFKTENGDIAQTCVIVGRVNWETTLAEIDWLNVHHFDYRGLIDKGLAIEVTEKNNPY